jgi:hypothetical protein
MEDCTDFAVSRPASGSIAANHCAFGQAPDFAGTFSLLLR